MSDNKKNENETKKFGMDWFSFIFGIAVIFATINSLYKFGVSYLFDGDLYGLFILIIGVFMTVFGFIQIIRK